MVLKEDQLKVKAIVQDTIRLLVKSGLAYQLDVGIEGVIGITVDRDQVFLISLNETIQSDKLSPLGKPCGEEDKPSHGDASSAKSFSPGLSRKRRHPQQRHQQGDAGSEVSSFTPSPSYSQQDLADPDHGGGDPTTPASYRDGVNNSSSRKRRRFNAPPDDPTTLKREDSTSCFSEEDCAIVIKEEPKAELDAEDLGLDIAHEVPLAEANSVLEDLSTQFEGDPAHVADARDHHQAYYSWQQSVLLPPGSQNGGAPSGHVSGISAENHLLADQSQGPQSPGRHPPLDPAALVGGLTGCEPPPLGSPLGSPLGVTGARGHRLSRDELKAHLLGSAGPLVCARAIKQYGHTSLRRLPTYDLCQLFMELECQGLGHTVAMRQNMWFAKADPDTLPEDLISQSPLFGTILSPASYSARFHSPDKLVTKLSAGVFNALMAGVRHLLGDDYTDKVIRILAGASDCAPPAMPLPCVTQVAESPPIA